MYQFNLLQLLQYMIDKYNQSYQIKNFHTSLKMPIEVTHIKIVSVGCQTKCIVSFNWIIIQLCSNFLIDGNIQQWDMFYS